MCLVRCSENAMIQTSEQGFACRKEATFDENWPNEHNLAKNNFYRIRRIAISEKTHYDLWNTLEQKCT